jgi:hypothetical protein
MSPNAMSTRMQAMRFQHDRGNVARPAIVNPHVADAYR